MSLPAKPSNTAIHLDKELINALEMKAKAFSTSVSSLAEAFLRESLEEDLEDLRLIEERKDEHTVTLDEYLEEARLTGKV